jgi:hypothetical protein
MYEVLAILLAMAIEHWAIVLFSASLAALVFFAWRRKVGRTTLSFLGITASVAGGMMS